MSSSLSHRWLHFSFALFWVRLFLPIAKAEIINIWDLDLPNQPGQLTLYNPDINDAEYGAPLTSGDLNGDGFDDLIFSAMAADGPPNAPLKDRTGEVSIYFSPGTIGGQIDLRDPQPQVVRIYGEAAMDIFGIKSHVADVDGDGMKDLLVGAFYSDSGSRLDCGKLYIFSGRLLRDLLKSTRTLDLAQPWPAGVSVVIGPTPRARLGVWMATGDVNGDRFQDIIVGADQASGNADDPENSSARAEAGRIYVLKGPLGFDTRLDLAQPVTNSTVIYGVDAKDHLGSTVASGDIDGDGFSDILMGAGALSTLRNAFERTGGAGDGPDNSRQNVGDVHIVFGSSNLPATIDLSAPINPNVAVVYGAGGNVDTTDRLGEEIVTGDINGDGIDDLILGAYRADGPDDARPDAGEVYIIPGTPALRGQVIDLAIPRTNIITIFGANPGAIAGDSISVGDIDHDGCAEIFVGVPGDPGPYARQSAGGMVIVRGGPRLPNKIDLASPNVPVVWIHGRDVQDFAAYWAGAGDLDGDGSIDIIPNGMHGDGPDNRRTNAGEVYVVSGAKIAKLFAAKIPSPPRIKVSYSETSLLILEWEGTGILQSRPVLGGGAWKINPLSLNTNRLNIPTGDAAAFFRLVAK